MNTVGTISTSSSSYPELKTITIAGRNLELHSSGALWWAEQKLLVVADLHLEKGSSFAKSGTYLPPYDTKTTLEKLLKLIEKFNPATVISLGDSFHDQNAAARLPKSFHSMIETCQQGRKWIWITGNHDPILPIEIAGISTASIQIENLTFIHEPTTARVVGEIAGHLHPCARLRQIGRTVRRFCFVTDSQRLILPAFGAYTGGLNVLEQTWESYFPNNEFKVYILGTNRLFELPAKALVPD